MYTENLGRYFPKEIKTNELEDIFRFLNEVAGIHVLPKRDLPIPFVAKGKITQLYRAEQRQTAFSSMTALYSYLYGVPVADQFGNDHAQRRVVRGQIFNYLDKRVSKKIARAYWDLYYHRNQFRVANMYAANLALGALQDTPLTPQFSNQQIVSDESINAILSLLNGNQLEDPPYLPYSQLDLVEDKLYVVRFIEDRCVEALQTLARI